MSNELLENAIEFSLLNDESVNKTQINEVYAMAKLFISKEGRLGRLHLNQKVVY